MHTMIANISLSKLIYSKTNPRQIIREDSVAELAQSIASRGIMSIPRHAGH